MILIYACYHKLFEAGIDFECQILSSKAMNTLIWLFLSGVLFSVQCRMLVQEISRMRTGARCLFDSDNYRRHMSLRDKCWSWIFLFLLTKKWKLLVSHADTCNSLPFSFVDILTFECVVNTVSQIFYFLINSNLFMFWGRFKTDDNCGCFMIIVIFSALLLVNSLGILKFWECSDILGDRLIYNWNWKNRCQICCLTF